jgi:hypothetical protein
MYGKLQEQMLFIGEEIIAFLPSLLGGLVLLLIGLIMGWIAKRIIVQLLVLFRLEKLLVRFRWGEDFLKADVRYGFYNFIGSIAFLIIFLILLDGALESWRLTVISNLLQQGISVIPRIIIALIIFGVGWLIASWTSRSLHRTLGRERVPNASLLARFSKIILMVFFSAMALTELNFARTIVIIGFATIFIALAVTLIVLVVLGGKELIKKVDESDDEK